MVTLLITQINISACLTQHTSALSVSNGCCEMQTTAARRAVSRYVCATLLALCSYKRQAAEPACICLTGVLTDHPKPRVRLCLTRAMTGNEVTSKMRWRTQIQQVEAGCEMVQVMMLIQYHKTTTEMVRHLLLFSSTVVAKSLAPLLSMVCMASLSPCRNMLMGLDCKKMLMDHVHLHTYSSEAPSL